MHWNNAKTELPLSGLTYIYAMHSYARLRGHNLIVVPYAPYTIQRITGHPHLLSIIHEGQGGIYEVSSLQTNQVADIEHTDADHDWRIELGNASKITSMQWPDNFALTTDEQEPYKLFRLQGTNSIIWLEGPYVSLPCHEDFEDSQRTVADTQTTERWTRYEIQYMHEQQSWTQYHIVLTNGLMLTSQSLTEHKTTVDVAQTLAEELSL